MEAGDPRGSTARDCIVTGTRSSKKKSAGPVIRFRELAGSAEFLGLLRRLGERGPGWDELNELIEGSPYMLSIEDLVRAWGDLNQRRFAELVAVAAEYKVAPGAGAGWQLALALAEQFHPSFRKGHRGRPQKWTSTRRLMLAGDVFRERRDLLVTAPLPAETARRLAKRDPWRTLITRWTRGTLGADPAEALMRAYAAIPPAQRSMGRVMFLRCLEPSTKNPIRAWREDMQARVDQVREHGVEPPATAVEQLAKTPGELEKLSARELWERLLAAIAILPDGAGKRK